jgi:hypothetical protein
VEIFHRDVGWEARGVQGALEIVRGQEGDYLPEETNQARPETAEKLDIPDNKGDASSGSQVNDAYIKED